MWTADQVGIGSYIEAVNNLWGIKVGTSEDHVVP